ncbi:hypothetical protein F441_14422 [Phytophthora nicotianae CJ01A1]|uniref:Uncharacterized protein n=5 Tax=Phytophthora nicotianae TaxID=4792 RepID=V9EN81_PHYNI|nr:hypothetical protein F443_14550 [Phytophthora nicotianae P1569]ETK80017.1 hypothetical protein L915_14192 [Phytophthora nicotianae]ETO68630.1 hypothetical protein F444_14560 [Phytophthora nicotianae P1976]ETP09768.1 hypothetical protein F441_14422 [Phytophthora nicotianae CJ01A1]ETP37790.1 hypothetical protein F442_14386 [Phytophthora nicotianae P10297]
MGRTLDVLLCYKSDEACSLLPGDPKTLLGCASCVRRVNGCLVVILFHSIVGPPVKKLLWLPDSCVSCLSLRLSSSALLLAMMQNIRPLLRPPLEVLGPFCPAALRVWIR